MEKFFKKTHMQPEDIDFTEAQLVAGEHWLHRAIRSNDLAKQQMSSIEATQQLQRVYNDATQYLQQVSFSPSSSLIPVPGESSFSLDQPLHNLSQIKDETQVNLGMSDLHKEAAAHKVEGMITPTATVKGFKKRISRVDSSVKELAKDVEQTNNFLSSTSPYYLIGGQEEKE